MMLEPAFLLLGNLFFCSRLLGGEWIEYHGFGSMFEALEPAVEHRYLENMNYPQI